MWILFLVEWFGWARKGLTTIPFTSHIYFKKKKPETSSKFFELEDFPIRLLGAELSFFLLLMRFTWSCVPFVIGINTKVFAFLYYNRRCYIWLFQQSILIFLLWLLKQGKLFSFSYSRFCYWIRHICTFVLFFATAPDIILSPSVIAMKVHLVTFHDRHSRICYLWAHRDKKPTWATLENG